ncbi:FG-GAP repeat domain-containing protein [Parafilimonas sp.]|uniref:FG-GAP repeat domain-containing protein n=1 Tax=Parafilimonas sp. TaxID=1969739 RepID=UPI0039E36D15
MRKCKVSPWAISALILVLALAAWLIMRNFSPQENATAAGHGEALAKQYCAGCHLFPDPQLLDKKTWQNGVLPNMAMRLGLRMPGKDPYEGIDTTEARMMRSLNVYPEKPLISRADWQQITDYYTAQAPEEPLAQPPVAPIRSGLPQFQAQPVYIGENQLPNTSLLKYNSRQGKLYVGDGSKALYIFNKDLSLASNWFMPSPPVDVDFSGNGLPRLLCIGSIAPTQQRTGNFFTFDPSGNPAATAIRFDSLARPVSVASGDLDGDKKPDVLICSFGNYTGRLSWFESYDQRKEHVLLEQPGARRAEIVDMNKDGLPDIVALMAQAREELVLFVNKGKGQFEQKILYQFPSVYGVSYFELADFNKDGHPDILVTNGDNWDLSPIKKYYHGIRILMNDGQNNFKESFFYPSYGAEKAVARDFDLDGDPDIAAISFSNDLNKTEDGFLLLKNDGNMHFSAFSSPDAANGKWLTMEVADIDKDGDDDIVIGSFIYNISEMTKLVGRNVDRFPNFVVFWNKRK